MAPKKLPKNRVQKAKENIGTAKRISDAITPTYVPSEELMFQRTQNRQPVAHPEAHGGMLGNPDLHHKIGKKLRLAFLEKAYQLDPVGGITGLEQIDIAWGLQAGSGSKAILPMDLHAHRPHHAIARAEMLEPWGKDLEGLNSEIASANSIEELNSIYSGYIENNVIPELAHAEAMQGGYEKSGARGTKVPRNELTDLRDLWINQKEALEENRIEGLHELSGQLTLPIMSRHDLTMRQTAPQGGFTPLPQTTAHGAGGYRAPLTSAKQGTLSPKITDPNIGASYPKEIPSIPTVMQSLNTLYRGTKLLFDVLTIPLGGSQLKAQKEKEELEQMDIS